MHKIILHFYRKSTKNSLISAYPPLIPIIKIFLTIPAMLLIFYFTDNQLYVKFQKKLISHLWDNFRQMDQQTDRQSNKGDYNGPHQVYLY